MPLTLLSSTLQLFLSALNLIGMISLIWQPDLLIQCCLRQLKAQKKTISTYVDLVCFLCIHIADIVAINNSHGLSKVIAALHMLWEADAEASGQVTQQSGRAHSCKHARCPAQCCCCWTIKASHSGRQISLEFHAYMDASLTHAYVCILRLLSFTLELEGTSRKHLRGCAILAPTPRQQASACGLMAAPGSTMRPHDGYVMRGLDAGAWQQAKRDIRG